MIKIGNDVFIEDYIKQFQIKSTEGKVRFYFSDRTIKDFPDDYNLTRPIDNLLEYGFIQVDDIYINPYLIKGFRNVGDGTIKVYFPDTTSATLYLDDDAFEDLVAYFSGGKNN